MTSGQDAFNSQEAREFLEALFGDKPEGDYLHLWTLPCGGTGKDAASFFERTTRAILHAAEHSHNRNIWFGCGTRSQRFTSPKRGKAEHIAGIPGVWLDVDVKHASAHKSADVFPDKETALGFINGVSSASEAIGLPYSVLVDSGTATRLTGCFLSS